MVLHITMIGCSIMVQPSIFNVLIAWLDSRVNLFIPSFEVFKVFSANTTVVYWRGNSLYMIQISFDVRSPRFIWHQLIINITKYKWPDTSCLQIFEVHADFGKRSYF